MTKIYLIVIAILSAVLAFVLWQNGNYKEEIQLLTISNESMKIELETANTQKTALETQIKDLHKAQEAYFLERERNKEIIDQSTTKPVKKDEVADDDTINKVIDVWNLPLPTYGL